MSENFESRTELTSLLNSWSRGDDGAKHRALERVYPEIKEIVLRQVRRRHGLDLQATEILHEALVKLTEGKVFGWDHRAQFFKLAAQVVRQVLIDHARERGALKRGGAFVRCDVELERVVAEESHRGVDLLDLDRSLRRLEDFDELGARIVELRYFVGLSIPEVARALDIGSATVSRHWRSVRAWLRRELANQGNLAGRSDPAAILEG